MSAAASPAAPPPTMTIDSGIGRAPDGDARVAAGLASFSLTKTLSPTRSTRQHAIGSSAGARSASPVRRLKQA